MATATPIETVRPRTVTAGAEQVEDRDGRRDSRLLIWSLRAGLLVALLLLWEYLAGALDVEFFISRPTAIWAQLSEWVATGYLQQHLGITLQEMVFGFILGASTGIVAGFVLGLIPLLGRILDPFITAIYSLPKLALAPLFVLWFGIGMSMKVILTAVIVFFLVFWNTYTGVVETSRELIDVLKVIGAKQRHLIRMVVLPSAMTYMYVGLKLAIPYALVGAVVGELISSNRGLGYILMSSAGAFNTAGLLAALVILVTIATLMNAILNRSESRVMRWKRAGR
jgi:NitT/TauT family transport system permease protein